MKVLSIVSATLLAGTALAGDITLPAPVKEGGKPLMTLLAERKSSRSFSEKEIPLQTLSDLFWAANGINRPDGRRTAPSAMNRQEIDLSAVMKNGTFRYEAQGHKLVEVTSDDLRKTSGLPGFSGTAPLTIISVVNGSKQNIKEKTASARLGAVDCGFIGQNIYLFCASAGLNTVYLGTLNAPALGASLKLNEGSEAFFAQTVGYPAE